MKMRCRVVANVMGKGWGVSLGPGFVADVDEVIGTGGERLRDVTHPEWWEPVEPEVVAAPLPKDEYEV